LCLELQRGRADRPWLLDLLSTLTTGNHPYFAKDFVG